MSSAKCRPFCLGLNVLNGGPTLTGISPVTIKFGPFLILTFSRRLHSISTVQFPRKKFYLKYNIFFQPRRSYDVKHFHHILAEVVAPQINIQIRNIHFVILVVIWFTQWIQNVYLHYVMFRVKGPSMVHAVQHLISIISSTYDNNCHPLACQYTRGARPCAGMTVLGQQQAQCWLL